MNQIDKVCQTIEKTINQAVQKTLDQLEKDCDLICSTISSKLEQDRFDLSTYYITLINVVLIKLMKDPERATKMTGGFFYYV